MILSAFEELENENAKLRVALAFYAEPRNWTPGKSGPVPISFGDRGKRARTALQLTEPASLVTLQTETKSVEPSK